VFFFQADLSSAPQTGGGEGTTPPEVPPPEVTTDIKTVSPSARVHGTVPPSGTLYVNMHTTCLKMSTAHQTIHFKLCHHHHHHHQPINAPTAGAQAFLLDHILGNRSP
jgi:hypothetical protein